MADDTAAVQEFFWDDPYEVRFDEHGHPLPDVERLPDEQ